MIHFRKFIYINEFKREQKKADLGDKKISSRILGEPKQTRKGPTEDWVDKSEN